MNAISRKRECKKQDKKEDKNDGTPGDSNGWPYRKRLFFKPRFDAQTNQELKHKIYSSIHKNGRHDPAVFAFATRIITSSIRLCAYAFKKFRKKVDERRNPARCPILNINDARIAQTKKPISVWIDFMHT